MVIPMLFYTIDKELGFPGNQSSQSIFVGSETRLRPVIGPKKSTRKNKIEVKRS